MRLDWFTGSQSYSLFSLPDKEQRDPFSQNIGVSRVPRHTSVQSPLRILRIVFASLTVTSIISEKTQEWGKHWHTLKEKVIHHVHTMLTIHSSQVLPESVYGVSLWRPARLSDKHYICLLQSLDVLNDKRAGTLWHHGDIDQYSCPLCHSQSHRCIQNTRGHKGRCIYILCSFETPMRVITEIKHRFLIRIKQSVLRD